MGTYNRSVVEVFDGNEWRLNKSAIFSKEVHGDTKTAEPFTFQSYAIAAFIAGVRNDFEVTPIAKGRGLPEGHECIPVPEGYVGEVVMYSRYPDEITDFEAYGKTWVLLSELLDFDYNATFEDRRNYGPGPDTLDAGKGEVITYRLHLGDLYFTNLELLKTLGPPEHVRIVFAFD